jgi:hypothetical protein
VVCAFIVALLLLTRLLLLLLLQFNFRICDRQTNLDDACFGSNYLMRADNGQRDTWLMTGAEDWVMQYR